MPRCKRHTELDSKLLTAVIAPYQCQAQTKIYLLDSPRISVGETFPHVLPFSAKLSDLRIAIIQFIIVIDHCKLHA